MISQIVLIIGIVISSSNCQNANETLTNDKTGPAKVADVSVSGSETNYTFSVTLKSPDTGCNQYANWWEVISADGNALYYRRILAHSHVDEQPFTRSGGKVAIGADTEVIIRAHMYPSGYGKGNIALRGSVANGFTSFEVPDGFGSDLEEIDPQPTGCAF